MKRLVVVSPLVALASFLPVVTLLLASCAPSSYRLDHDHEFVRHRDVFPLQDREPPGDPVIYPGPEPSPDGQQPTGPIPAPDPDHEPPAGPQEPPGEPPTVEPEPARDPAPHPPTVEEPERCWHGHGHGDRNHAHCGPPGRRR